jgi:hypothetical protein
MTYEQGERIISLLEALVGVSDVHASQSVVNKAFPLFPDIAFPAKGRYERHEYKPRTFNLYYDRFSEAIEHETPNPNNNQHNMLMPSNCSLQTAPIEAVCNIATMMDRLNLPVQKFDVQNVESLEELQNDENVNIYPVDIWSGPHQRYHEIGQIIANISDDAKELIKSGKLSLLLSCDGEAFSADEHQWFRRLTETIIAYGLTEAKIVLTCADLDIQQNYQLWSEANKDITEKFQFRKVLGIDYFATQYTEQFLTRTGRMNYENLEGTLLPQKRYNEDMIQKEIMMTVPSASEKTTDFMCLNAASRPHRIAIVSELQRLGLQNNFISLLWRYQPSPSISGMEFQTRMITEGYFKFESQKEYFLKHYDEDRMSKVVQLDMGVGTLGEDDRAYTSKYFKESYFSIITETQFGITKSAYDHAANGDICLPYNRTFMLTEKVYKPIANFHPIIIMGCPGTLQYLRDEGYKTFPEMFDESYDKIEDKKERFCAIVGEIEKWTSYSEEEKAQRYNAVRESLRYNHELFIDKYTSLRERHSQYYNCIGTCLK